MRRRLIGPVVVAAIMVGGAACSPGPNAGDHGAPTDQPPSTSQAAASRPADCLNADISVNHLPYTIAALVGRAKSGFVGTVNRVEDGIWNTATGAQPSLQAREGPGFDPEILTPVDVVVDGVVSGKGQRGSLRALNEGGRSGCSSVKVPSAPVMSIGRQYVIWTRPGRDLDGRQRPDLDVVITAWLVDRAGRVSTEEDGAMSIELLLSRVADAAE
jgi:hypothetical protein